LGVFDTSGAADVEFCYTWFVELLEVLVRSEMWRYPGGLVVYGKMVRRKLLLVVPLVTKQTR